MLGRERFHFSTPEDMWTKMPYSRYLEKEPEVKDIHINNITNKEVKINIFQGYNCCSKYSISFHNIKSDMMLQLHSFLYTNTCKISSLSSSTPISYHNNILPSDMAIMKI